MLLFGRLFCFCWFVGFSKKKKSIVKIIIQNCQQSRHNFTTTTTTTRTYSKILITINTNTNKDVSNSAIERLRGDD